MSSTELTNNELLFADVMLRVKAAFDCKTDKALAETIGMSPQSLINRSKTGSVPYDEIIRACVARGLSIDAVLFGKRIVNYAAEPQNSYATDFAEIPHYNVMAAAGFGKLASEQETSQPLSFRRDWLAKRHLTPGNLAIVNVSGDSMEPYLKDGDLVLVDRSQTNIASGKTYVLRLDGHLLVKNLQLLPHGLIQVASFNPGFPPYQVDLADESLDIAVIGRVVASMQEW